MPIFFLQIIKMKDVFTGFLDFAPIADSRDKNECGNRTDLNMRNPKQAFLFPCVNDDRCYVLRIDRAGKIQEFSHVFEAYISLDVFSQSAEKGIKSENIEERSCRECLFLHSLKDLLLAFCAAEVPLGIIMPLSHVFESRLPI